jgi:hypothetical protein
MPYFAREQDKDLTLRAFRLHLGNQRGMRRGSGTAAEDTFNELAKALGESVGTFEALRAA